MKREDFDKWYELNEEFEDRCYDFINQDNTGHPDAGYTGHYINWNSEEVDIQWDVSWIYGGHDAGEFSVPFSDFFKEEDNDGQSETINS